MPGYYVHLASCNKNAIENRSFVLGVEAPDLLKKHLKLYGDVKEARKKYDLLKTADMPDYSELENRIMQKESVCSTDGLHYGVSSCPYVYACWNSLTIAQKSSPFYRGYIWHLLTDRIMYGRLNIDAKFKDFCEVHKNDPNIDELKKAEIKKLHYDWDKTNAKIRDTYPSVILTDEVKELNVVGFIEDDNLSYVNLGIVLETIEFLRTFDPLNANMDLCIEEVLNNI